MTKKKVKKDKKVSRNISISESLHNWIEDIGKPSKENRNFSNMTELLLMEAKEAREKK